MPGITYFVGSVHSTTKIQLVLTHLEEYDSRFIKEVDLILSLLSDVRRLTTPGESGSSSCMDHNIWFTMLWSDARIV